MVCDRCVMAVDQTLRSLQLHPTEIVLGEAVVGEDIDEVVRDRLRKELAQIGFELLDDHRRQTIEKIRTAIVRLVHYTDSHSDVTLSSYLADELHADYSSLSKLFSEVVGITIERYFILQRIERVKELLCYDELSLSQIALQMRYSSTAYLSSQFKSVTGMTPSQFKQTHVKGRTPLDKV